MAVPISEVAQAIDVQLKVLQELRRHLPPFDASEADRLEAETVRIHTQLGAFLARALAFNAIALSCAPSQKSRDGLRWASGVLDEASNERRTA